MRVEQPLESKKLILGKEIAAQGRDDVTTLMRAQINPSLHLNTQYSKVRTQDSIHHHKQDLAGASFQPLAQTSLFVLHNLQSDRV